MKPNKKNKKKLKINIQQTQKKNDMDMTYYDIIQKKPISYNTKLKEMEERVYKIRHNNDDINIYVLSYVFFCLEEFLYRLFLDLCDCL